jgi:PAS domain S-box-containing protein
MAKVADSSRLQPERRKRELAERPKREAIMEDLFASVAEAIFIVEPDGRILDVNPAACELLGYSKEEFLAMRPWDFVTSASREEILDLARNMRPGIPVTVQRTYRSKAGELKIMDLRLTRCTLASRDLIVVSCRDITEQKRLEERLRRSEKNLAEGQRLTKTGSWILD